MLLHPPRGLKQFVAPLLTAVLNLTASCAVLGGEYPNVERMGQISDKGADWYKQCIRVKGARPAATDVPPKDSIDRLARCEPTDLYYDTKSKPNPKKADWARVGACAFAKNDTGVLMMLYANGFGVKQNVDLALKYACMTGGASAEVAFRIGHILSTPEHAPGDYAPPAFDLCDDITSGYMMGYCARIKQRQDEHAREARLAELVGGWVSAQKLVLEKLRSLLETFAVGRASNETDTLGTGRAGFMIEAMETERQLFLADIEQFEKGGVPQYNERQFVELDRKLNEIYQKLMRANTQAETARLGYSSITKEGVRETQRAWIRYRDGWDALGRTRYPSVSPFSWRAHLTERRVRQLEEILGYADE